MFSILGYQNRARAPDEDPGRKRPYTELHFLDFLFYDFGTIYIHLIEIQSMAEQQHPSTGRVCTTDKRACLGCSQRLFSMLSLPTCEPGANITRETLKSI